MASGGGGKGDSEDTEVEREGREETKELVGLGASRRGSPGFSERLEGSRIFHFIDVFCWGDLYTIFEDV